MIELDEIGLIVDQFATYDAEGNELAPTTFVDGWHVNALYPVPEFSDYLLDPPPATPNRVFAGVPLLYAYKFPDKQCFINLAELAGGITQEALNSIESLL